MVAIDLPNPRRLAYGVVLGQAVVTGIAALVSLAVADEGAVAMWLLRSAIGHEAPVREEPDIPVFSDNVSYGDGGHNDQDFEPGIAHPPKDCT